MEKPPTFPLTQEYQRLDDKLYAEALMFGCTRHDLDQLIASRPPVVSLEMLAMSMLSDAQEVMASSHLPSAHNPKLSRGVYHIDANTANQYVNRAKYVLSKIIQGVR